MDTRKYDELDVLIAHSNDALGKAAADDFASAVKTALESQADIAVILALGSSQLTFFHSLLSRDDIEWSRITVLHVDTYVGISEDDPASGSWRLKNQLLDHVKPKKFLGLHGDHEPVEEEIARYSRIVNDHQPVICVMGMGESGHLAFNDPPADFETEDAVRAVALSEVTRRQIVNGGVFGSIDDVPFYGLTLTIKALLRPKTVLVLVPEPQKAQIVKRVLEEPVSIMRPGSILRHYSNARLYLDPDSSALLEPTS